jgi:hypothetical protein
MFDGVAVGDSLGKAGRGHHQKRQREATTQCRKVPGIVYLKQH